ncbi:aspartyl/asparaginyl beta-hydroxylase domain-containing protein [Streptomyces sp. M19]
MDQGGLPLRAAAITAAPRPLSLLCPTRNRVDNLNAFLRSVQRTAAARAGSRCSATPTRTTRAAGVPEAVRPGALALRGDRPLRPARRAADRRRGGLERAGRTRRRRLPADGQRRPAVRGLRLGRGAGPAGRGADRTARGRRAVPVLRRGAVPGRGCDFPIVSRSWYDTLGYFVPTIFQQWEVEKWVFDLARRLGRLYPVPGVLVEHRHYQDYKAPFDDTYQRHRMTREKSLADHALFVRTEHQRVAEADKLAARTARGRRGDGSDDRRGDGRGDRRGDRHGAAPPARTCRDRSPTGPAATTGRSSTTCTRAARPGRRGLRRTRRTPGPVDLALHRPRSSTRSCRCARTAILPTSGSPASSRPNTRRSWGDARRVRRRPAAAGRRRPGRGRPCRAVPRRRVDRVGRGAAPPARRPRHDPRGVAVPRGDRRADAPAHPGRDPARCGPSNAFLRVEFGLLVAAGSGIRIGERSTTWPHGGCLIYDDGLERERWHQGAGPNAVLTFRVPRQGR